jgi:uncharacterized protein (TIGR02266 family)
MRAMRERRKNNRVALHADVDVSTGSNFFVGRAQDISSGGLFIQSDTLLDPGTEVQVKVRIPGRLFVIDCVVRWGLSSPDGKPIGYGVEFVDLTPPAKKAIETFMTTRNPMAFDGLEPEPDDEPAPAAPSPTPGAVSSIPRPKKRPPPLPT